MAIKNNSRIVSHFSKAMKLIFIRILINVYLKAIFLNTKYSFLYFIVANLYADINNNLVFFLIIFTSLSINISSNFEAEFLFPSKVFMA